MFRSNGETNQLVVATKSQRPFFADEVGVSHEDEVKDVVFSRRLRDILSHKYVFQILEESVALLVASHSAPVAFRTVKVPYNY